MQVAVRPLVPDRTVVRVSTCQGRVSALLAQPPQRFATRSPSTQTATAAPTSLPCSKLRSNCSRTPENSDVHDPLTAALLSASFMAPFCRADTSPERATGIEPA